MQSKTVAKLRFNGGTKMSKYINLDKLNDILYNDKREAFSKHQVWLLLNYHPELVINIDIDISNEKNDID